MQENCFIKACLVQHIFEVERDSLQTKKQKCLSLPDHQLAENMKILILVSMKGQKNNKSESAAIICSNYSYDYFHIKIFLKFVVKPLLHSVFLLIT